MDVLYIRVVFLRFVG